MPELIADYAAHLDQLADARAGDTLDQQLDAVLPQIQQRILARTDHDLRQYKQATLIRRIQRRMQALRLADPAAYLARLDSEPEEVDALHRDILIGVTGFFRDPEAFAALEELVIPVLLRRAAEHGRDLRIWVPGCGSGEEAYSIAILLREAMERTGQRPEVQIFGTDIDAAAIRQARQGVYPHAAAEQLSAQGRERFLFHVEDGVRVEPALRDLCLFSEHDLIRHPPLSRMDLISCRNLLIYLTGELQTRLLPVFHYALNPGGFLFLGSSETVGQQGDLFETIDKKHRIYRRREGARTEVPTFPLAGGRLPRQLPSAPAQQSEDDTRARLTRKAERVVLETFGPPYVVVTANYDAVYFSRGIGRYLEPAAGTPRANVLEMARFGLRSPLRRSLQAAAEAPRSVHSEQVEINDGAERRTVELFVRQVRERHGTEQMYVLVFREPAEPERAQPAAPAAEPAGDPQELERELAETKSELQSTIEELETSNEELQSAYEELLSMNEELQSSNEELESSKEELQSTNEELETVNDELRRRVDELNRSNADLRNLIRSTRIATVFLDRDGRIKWFTPDARQLFNLIDADIGRPFTDISARLDAPPGRELAGTLETGEPVERPVDLADGSATFIMRILPYRDSAGAADGLVLTFIDVTQLRRATADLTTLLDLVPVGIALTRDDRAESVRVNRYGCRLLGLEPGTEITGDALAGFFRFDADAPAGSELPLRRAARDGDRVPETAAWVPGSAGPNQRAVLLSAAPLGQSGTPGRGAIMAFADITEIKTSQRRQRLLLSALQHRVRNMLANIRAIASETLSSSPSLDDFAERFEGRLNALALTENITARTGRGSVDLDELANELVAGELRDDHVTIGGPEVALEPRAAQMLALVFNELTTNAIKHGALAGGGGRIALTWAPAAGADGRDLLRITWRETEFGAPPEGAAGFGRELVERGVPYELGGHGRLTIQDDVLTCVLDVPMTPHVLAIAGDPGDAGPAGADRTDRDP
jgi:two-component system CheB/CheR fusion protein